MEHSTSMKMRSSDVHFAEGVHSSAVLAALTAIEMVPRSPKFVKSAPSASK